MSSKKKVEDELPRLIYDPDSGVSALEFRRLQQKHHSCIDRRIIIGAFEASLAVEEGHIIASNVGCLDVAGNVVFTDHSYFDLRDLLYPILKEGVF